MLRKLLDGVKSTISWAMKGAMIGTPTGFISHSIGYPIMKSFKSCDVMLNYASSLGCNYENARDKFGDRCGKIYKCNETTVDLIHNFDTAISMSYNPYALWGTIAGATFGAIIGLGIGIYIISAPPLSREEELKTTFSAREKISIGAAGILLFGGMYYLNYLVANLAEDHDLHSYQSNSMSYSAALSVIAGIIGAINTSLFWGLSEKCAASNLGIFSRPAIAPYVPAIELVNETASNANHECKVGIH